MNKNQEGSAAVIITIVVMILAIGGALFFVLSNSDDDSSSSSDTSNSEQTEQVADTTEKEEDDNPENYEEINLMSVNGYSGEGVAIRSIGSANFTHEVYAQLSDPAEGKFYEGWLVGDSIVSTGKLTKNNEGNWYLSYSTNDDLSNHDRVVITEETEADGLDGKPEAHVLEGSF